MLTYLFILEVFYSQFEYIQWIFHDRLGSHLHDQKSCDWFQLSLHVTAVVFDIELESVTAVIVRQLNYKNNWAWTSSSAVHRNHIYTRQDSHFPRDNATANQRPRNVIRYYRRQCTCYSDIANTFYCFYFYVRSS